MPYGLSADANSRLSSELVQRVEASLAARGENVVVFRVGGAEVDEPVEVVENPNLAEDSSRYEARGHSANCQPVRTGCPVHVVPSFSAPAAGHVLHNEGGVSWNMLLKNGNNGFCPHVSQAARFCPGHDGNRLTFIGGALCKRVSGSEKNYQKSQKGA